MKPGNLKIGGHENMSDFKGMSNDQLVLCARLLQADAKLLESIGDLPESKTILGKIADERRALAARMMDEVSGRISKRRGEA
jgi:hypothetical protein